MGRGGGGSDLHRLAVAQARVPNRLPGKMILCSEGFADKVGGVEGPAVAIESGGYIVAIDYAIL